MISADEQKAHRAVDDAIQTINDLADEADRNPRFDNTRIIHARYRLRDARESLAQIIHRERALTS
jgi:hypothetical protein